MKKYKAKNVIYYFKYKLNILSIPLVKFKFLDEASFNGSLLNSDFGLSWTGMSVRFLSLRNGPKNKNSLVDLSDHQLNKVILSHGIFSGKSSPPNEPTH